MIVQKQEQRSIKKKSTLFVITGLILSAVIFLIDLQTPLGIADGVSYVAVVLLTIWIPEKRYVYYAALLGISLTLVGFALSPPGESMGIVIPNRVLAIIGIVSAAIIILSYKKKQELAEKTQEQLSALFQHADEGIFILDHSGKIILSNPKALRLFNFESTGIKGKLFTELIPDFPITAANNKFFEHAINESDDPKKNAIAYRNNRSQFPVEFSLSQYQTSEGLFNVVFLKDITNRKKNEEELLKAHHDLEITAQELKRSNAELENFAYISSHDLQEPLRKIQSFGSRLKAMESKTIGEQSNDYLDRMLNAALRMQNLINDLLLFSRVTNKKQPFAQVNVKQIFEQIIGDLELTIEQNQAKIESALDKIVIEGDPTQIGQLFLNLLTNAIKFSRPNVPPVIKIHSKIVTLTESGDQKFLKIYFEDNGIGFDQKYAERIFTIFQRLEGSKYPGSGIGLTICMKIARHHGGNISVTSEVGKGTNFIILLPMIQRQPVTEDFINKIISYESK